MMPPKMAALGIPLPAPDGRRFACPLCEERGTLMVQPADDKPGEYWWACSNCAETGSSEDGWHELGGLGKGYLTLQDIDDELHDVFFHGLEKGLPLEWSSLSEYYSVRRGEWTLVTGMPGHGKSEFMDSLLLSLAVDHGWRFGIFSPENMPHKLHATKLIEKAVGKPALPHRKDQMSIEQFEQARKMLSDRFFFVYPKRKSIEDILAVAEFLVRKHGIQGLVIDPWNEIEHQRPRDEHESEYVSKVLSRIRNFARVRKLHIWLVAHPTKMVKDKQGNYPVPRPYDVSGSAHFYNKADNCLSVWRDAGHKEEEKRNVVEVHVQKVRFKIVGKVGMTELRYELASGRFIDQENDFQYPAPLERWQEKQREEVPRGTGPDPAF